MGESTRRSCGSSPPRSRRIREQVLSPLPLLLIGVRPGKEFVSELPLAGGGGVPPVLAQRIASKAFRDGREKEPQRHSQAWFAGLQLNKMNDLPHFCIGCVVAATTPQIGRSREIDFGKIMPEHL